MTEPNARKPRRQFTAEFKADAVRLATTNQTSIAQTARDLGIGDEPAMFEGAQEPEVDGLAGDECGLGLPKPALPTRKGRAIRG